MVKKTLMLLFLAAAVLLPTTAEGDLSMELGISHIVLQTRETEPVYDMSNPEAPALIGTEGGDKYWALTSSGSGAFSFKSSGNKNVKADLAFSFAFPETDISEAAGVPSGTVLMPLLSLDRAWVKARFPWFRVALGKTRLDWGEGFVFNAGDIIQGSTDTTVDLTAAELRTETNWLAALNIPLGRFSFIEGVYLPPEPDIDAGESIGRINKSSGGGRLYTKLAGVKIEAGYFFDQTAADNSSGEALSARHEPYFSLQGNLLADWYLSTSAALPDSGNPEELFRDSLNISGGLFYIKQLNSISTISFRIEGLYNPFFSWQEESRDQNSEPPVYALLLYPEISWSPVDTVNLSVRSIWSPVDMSAMAAIGAGWNVFEGFDLNFYAVANAGDPDDTFAWNRDNSLWIPGVDIIDGAAFILGINYIY